MWKGNKNGLKIKLENGSKRKKRGLTTEATRSHEETNVYGRQEASSHGGYSYRLTVKIGQLLKQITLEHREQRPSGAECICTLDNDNMESAPTTVLTYAADSVPIQRQQMKTGDVFIGSVSATRVRIWFVAQQPKSDKKKCV